MLDEIAQALDVYQQTWKGFVASRADQAFFEGLRPFSVGWKVADAPAYRHAFNELASTARHINAAWKNDRWLATFYLPDADLPGGIQVVNLMQRRPGSEDRCGMDNVNFPVANIAELEAVLRLEPTLKWTYESNGQHSSWISLWFADTEAKLREGTVIDVNIRELTDLNNQLLKGYV